MSESNGAVAVTIVIGFAAIAISAVAIWLSVRARRNSARARRVTEVLQAAEQARAAAGGWGNISPEERDEWMRRINEAGA